MPVWLQDVMQIFPTPRFVSFFQAVVYRAAGLDIVWPELLMMAAISAVSDANAFAVSRRCRCRSALQSAKTEMFNLAATSFAFRSSMASILPAFASPRLDQRHDGVADQRKGHDDHGGGDHVRPVMRHLCVVR